MDNASVILLIQLVAEGIGVAKELAELAQRIQNGQPVTSADIAQARQQIDEAKSDWKKAIGKE